MIWKLSITCKNICVIIGFISRSKRFVINYGEVKGGGGYKTGKCGH